MDKKHKKITANSSLSLLMYIKKIYTYKALFLMFAQRDLRVKYSQTLAGLLWALVQPVAGLLLFNFFFGKLLNIGTIGTPYYPLFAFTGMIGWYYFSYIVAYSGTSLIESQHLMKKMYFPKLILPISKALSGLTEFVIWLVILIVLMIIYKTSPSIKLIFFPFFVLMNIFTGLTIGIWLSSITFRYRDLIQIIPYMVGFSIFVTPVFYPVSLIPQSFHYLIYLNPVAGVIEGYRWCILPGYHFSILYFGGFLLMLLILISSLLYFKKIENKIVDVI